MLSKTKLKQLAKLRTKKERSAQGKFLIEGLRLCEEAAFSSWSIESFLFAGSFGQKTRERKLLEKLHSLRAAPLEVKSQDLAKLSNTVTAQGIVCVVKAKRRAVTDLWKKRLLSNSTGGLVLALDGISDPGNVGTLIRTADAFAADAVLLSHHTVEPYNPKVIRSSMGSIFHLPVFDEVDLETTIPQLKKMRFRILGTHAKGGQSLGRVRPSERVCLLIGGEAEGLSNNLLKASDELVHIPTYGKAESLNVAVATGILLHELKEKTLAGERDSKASKRRHKTGSGLQQFG